MENKAQEGLPPSAKNWGPEQCAGIEFRTPLISQVPIQARRTIDTELCDRRFFGNCRH
jgi:hypothetical protein